MPQLGLLMILVLLPLQMLSGGSTPRESMPQAVQDIMLTMPTTHFVSLAQAILYRGADFSIVWPQFLTLLAIGGVFLLSRYCVFVRRSGKWPEVMPVSPLVAVPALFLTVHKAPQEPGESHRHAEQDK